MHRDVWYNMRQEFCIQVLFILVLLCPPQAAYRDHKEENEGARFGNDISRKRTRAKEMEEGEVLGF